MNDINLDDYYCGGYFLIRARERADWLNTKLLPSRIVSLSTHISPRLMVYWGWKPGDKQAALDFGIPDHKLDEFLQWCIQPSASEMYPGVFHSPLKALQFINDFELDKTDLHIIGAGLHKKLEEANWREVPENEKSDSGIELLIEKHVHLESGGANLGHEVVGWSHNSYDCSWLCNGVEKDAYELFAIKPNQYGHITDYADAKKIYDWIMVDPASRAEPIGYDIWLLVSYPLE